MASIIKFPSGRRAIQFTDPADPDKRPKIQLGKISDRAAQTVRGHIEALVSARITRTAPPDETSRWTMDIGPDLHAKLTRAGLCEAREKKSVVTLGELLKAYIDSRADVKAATHLVFGHTRRCLLDFFDEGVDVSTITSIDAENWRRSLKTEHDLAANTIRRRTGIARQFFAHACKRGIIAVNPFAGMAANVVANPSRFYYVSREQIDRVIDECPCGQWRLLVALARYGGLRVPSEALSLEWKDIDWDRGRMTVKSPKTIHHPGGGARIVPIFPEVFPHLRDAFEAAAEGETHVINRYRGPTKNLRTHFDRIIQRAGVQPWPKLWQNLRSSRETELVETFPVHVVTRWLGNSPDVANRHYLQTTEEHYRIASGDTPEKRVRNQVRQMQESSGIDGNEEMKIVENPNKTAILSSAEGVPMGVTGLEPVTSCMSSRRSSQLS